MKWAGLAFQIVGIICAVAAAVITYRRFSEVGFWRSLGTAFGVALFDGLWVDYAPAAAENPVIQVTDAGVAEERGAVATVVAPLPPGRTRKQVAALYGSVVQLSADLDQVRSDGAAAGEALGLVRVEVTNKTRELAAGTIYLQVGGLVLVAIGTVLGTLA